MSHLVTLMKRFAEDENGAALVEYAVIFAVLVGGSIAVLGAIGPQIQAVFQSITTQLTATITPLIP